jgi:predicted PurR-regulated permease PerM
MIHIYNMMGTMLHIIFNILLSGFIIYCFHSTWDYFKNTYTHKKTKDLVNTQITKYQQMMDEMQQTLGQSSSISRTDIQMMEEMQQTLGQSSSISRTDIQMMDDDLTKFMEQQM